MSVDPESPEATPAVEPTPPAPPANPGPWSADLDAYFGDNAEAKAAADRYMREKVQPRITELEQGSAPARELWKDMMDDAPATLAALVEEVYGEEFGSKYTALLDAGATPEQAATAVAGEAEDGEPPAWAKPLLDDFSERRDQKVRADNEAEYQEVLAEMRRAHPDLTDDDMGLVHPFMAVSGRDIEAAYAGFQAYKQAMRESLGVQQQTQEDPPPPATLGTAGSAPAVPPVEKDYKGDLGAAVDDWFAERRDGSPPPVI